MGSGLRSARRDLSGRYRRWAIARSLPAMPAEAIVPLDEADDAILLCARSYFTFVPQAYMSEVAFAQELAARDRPFAVTDDASQLFGKSVAWVLPGERFVSPALWDYSRQAYEFAAGLERQGNRPFRSATETALWENKAFMHQRLAEIGAPTPRTVTVTSDNRDSVVFDIEPVLLKEEHSAGSTGIHHFQAALGARRFVDGYRFRPGEALIMQEVVPGATRDLRLTVVGERIISSASYWRIKRPEPPAGQRWTTTATTYGSKVEHGNLPPRIGPMAVAWMRQLGIRTAGFDLMWEGDDLSREPVILELSPHFQPNPPKPERYAGDSYARYKQRRRIVRDGYLLRQYDVLREISGALLDQELF